MLGWLWRRAGARAEPPPLPVGAIAPAAVVAAPRAPARAVPPHLAPVPPDRVALAQTVMAIARENRGQTAPRHVSAPKLAELLVAWMQHEGYDGWVLMEEIDAALNIVCNDMSVLRLSTQPVLEALQGLPGVRNGRYRLNGPEFAAVKARRRALLAAAGRSSTCERARVYWIPASRADAEARTVAESLPHLKTASVGTAAPGRACPGRSGDVPAAHQPASVARPRADRTAAVGSPDAPRADREPPGTPGQGRRQGVPKGDRCAATVDMFGERQAA